MTGSQGIVVFVHKLDKCAAKLCEVIVYEICQFLAGQDRLFLKDAHISPCIYDSGLHIPECSVTEKIGVIM